jgi:hypothetical protein
MTEKPRNVESIIVEVVKAAKQKQEQLLTENPSLLAEFEKPPKCPKCRDTHWVFKVKDNRRFARPCQCALDEMSEEIFRNVIPEIYQCVPRIKDLKPHEMLPCPVGVQQTMIDAIKDDPFEGFFMVGPTGTGKTYLMWSLFKEATYRGRDTYYTTCRNLVSRLRQAEFNRNETYDPDLITKDKLKATLYGPAHIFIDEWGKMSMTDYAYDQLFELVDYCSCNPSQVKMSIATNYTLEEFKNLYGDAMLRRIHECTTSLEWGE